MTEKMYCVVSKNIATGKETRDMVGCTKKVVETLVRLFNALQDGFYYRAEPLGTDWSAEEILEREG